MTTLVGVDAGGSHTDAALSGPDLEIRVRTRGTPARVSRGSEAETARTLTATVTHLLAPDRETGHPSPPPDALVAGVSGAGDETVRARLEQCLLETGLARRVSVTTDIAIAFQAAFGTGGGILLVGGTGSIAQGRDRTGKIVQVGGYGWQFGDDGSASSIGRAALNAVLRARDGRGPATELTGDLADGTFAPGAECDPLVRAWIETATPARVAALTHAVLARAPTDETARAIVTRAIEDLAAHVTALLDTLDLDPPVPLALSGGLFRKPVLRHGVLNAVRRHPTAVTPVDDPDPVAGALALARDLVG